MVHTQAAAIDIDAATPDVGPGIGDGAIAEHQNAVGVNFDCATGKRMAAPGELQPVNGDEGVDFEKLLISGAVLIRIAADGEQISAGPIEDDVVIQDDVGFEVNCRGIDRKSVV